MPIQLTEHEIERRVDVWEAVLWHETICGVVSEALPMSVLPINRVVLRMRARRQERDSRRRIPAPVKRAVREQPCAYCGDDAQAVDHVVPIAKGGTSDPENLAAACRRCNEEKLDFTPEEWREWRISMGRSWPPNTLLEDHLRFLADRGA